MALTISEVNGLFAEFSANKESEKFDLSNKDDLRLKAYPNPFLNSIDILIELGENQWVNVDIYDIHGNLVRKLSQVEFPVGKHLLHWNGNNLHGSQADAGIYVIRATTAKRVQHLTIIKK